MRTNLKNNRDMADFIWNDIVVSIDDRRLHGFRSLNLHQPVGDHHSFELTLDPDTVGKRYVEGFTDGTEWLGKRMLVHAHGDDTAVFLGVVSKVCIRKESLDGARCWCAGIPRRTCWRTDRASARGWDVPWRRSSASCAPRQGLA